MLDLFFSQTVQTVAVTALQSKTGSGNILQSPLCICSHFQEVSHVIILAVLRVVVTVLQFKINSGTWKQFQFHVARLWSSSMLDLLFSRDSIDRGGGSSAVQDWQRRVLHIRTSMCICSHFQDVRHIIILTVQRVGVITLQFKIISGN